MNDLRTIKQAAEFLGRPVATLYDWRLKNVGPRSAKIQGRVVYRQSDLEAYVDAQFAAGRGDELAAAGE